MVKIIESQRLRLGAGRRKRPSNKDKSYIYYTATNGRTILDDDNQLPASKVQDASDDELPSARVETSTIAVTPSIRKRNHGHLDVSDKPSTHHVDGDTSSVQVILEDDHQLNERNHSDSSLQGNENGINSSSSTSFQDEKIRLLTKQLQEKEETIVELLQSKATSFSPATMMRTQNLNSKTIQSMQFHLEEMKQNHDNEIAQLKVDLTKWKGKAADLSLEVERLKYNSLHHRNVYNGRFLLEETATFESTFERKQNEQKLTLFYNGNKSTEVAREEAKSRKRLTSSPDHHHLVCVDSEIETKVPSCNANDTGEYRPKKPVVSPRTIKNITYLGIPLSLKPYLDKTTEFQLMVTSPIDDSEDESTL